MLYMIEKTKDRRLQTDYLVLWGSLQNGNMILMRTAVESIKESVDIANRFLAYVGVIMVIPDSGCYRHTLPHTSPHTCRFRKCRFRKCDTLPYLSNFINGCKRLLNRFL